MIFARMAPDRSVTSSTTEPSGRVPYADAIGHGHPHEGRSVLVAEQVFSDTAILSVESRVVRTAESVVRPHHRR